MPTKIASILAFPGVAEWHKQVARKAVGTANLYLQSIYTYWTNSISPAVSRISTSMSLTT
jgi:hypothetical protein